MWSCEPPPHPNIYTVANAIVDGEMQLQRDNPIVIRIEWPPSKRYSQDRAHSVTCWLPEPPPSTLAGTTPRKLHLHRSRWQRFWLLSEELVAQSSLPCLRLRSTARVTMEVAPTLHSCVINQWFCHTDIQSGTATHTFF